MWRFAVRCRLSSTGGTEMGKTKIAKLTLAKITLRMLSSHEGRLVRGGVGNLPDIPIFRLPTYSNNRTECENTDCQC
jgi:hypothetical protein